MKIHPTNTTILIASYNDIYFTLNCLKALHNLKHYPLSIIVIDNGSTAETTVKIAEAWKILWSSYGKPKPIVLYDPSKLIEGKDALLCLDENLGFAGGHNVALKHITNWSSCSAVWLLNNDTLPQPHALEHLCTCLNSTPTAGLCGSTVFYIDNPEMVQCAGGGYLNKWLGTTRLYGDGSPLTQVPKKVAQPLDFVFGASCLVRKKVFSICGLLPEEYFLYYEEVDFALRARKYGFECVWAKDSHVLHHEGGSTGAKGSGKKVVMRPAWVDYLVIRNRFNLIRRWFLYTLPVSLAGLTVVTVNRLRRGQADRIPLLIKAAWHGLRGKMGKIDFTVGGRC